MYIIPNSRINLHPQFHSQFQEISINLVITNHNLSCQLNWCNRNTTQNTMASLTHQSKRENRKTQVASLGGPFSTAKRFISEPRNRLKHIGLLAAHTLLPGGFWKIQKHEQNLIFNRDPGFTSFIHYMIIQNHFLKQ